MRSMCEEQDRRQQWLATLAQGSEVFIKARRGAYGNALHPRKVVRTTATQAILDRGERYRLKDGREVGDSGNCIVEPTPECRAVWQAEKNRERLATETGYLRDSRSKLTDEEIAAMLAALDAARGNGDSEGQEELEAARDYAEDLEATLELVAKALGVPAELHQGRAERVLGAAEAMAAHQAALVFELTACQGVLHSLAHRGEVTREYADEAKAVLKRTKEASLAWHMQKKAPLPGGGGAIKRGGATG